MRDPKNLGQALLDIASRHMPAEVLRFVAQGIAIPQAGACRNQRKKESGEDPEHDARVD